MEDCYPNGQSRSWSEEEWSMGIGPFFLYQKTPKFYPFLEIGSQICLNFFKKQLLEPQIFQAGSANGSPALNFSS